MSNFKLNLFLSTDGKNTVSMEADTPEGREAGIVYARALYDKILAAYGNKNQQLAKSEPKQNLGVCKDCGGKMGMSKKGNPYCLNRCWLKGGTQ